MSNLLKQLQSVQQQRAAAPQPGAVDRLRSQLATKATGRVGQTSGPRASNVMEQAAIGEQQAQAGQLQQQGQQAVAGQQIQEQGQVQQFEQQAEQLRQQRQSNINQFNRQAENISNELQRSKDKLQTEKGQFDLAILGQTQALQDKQYTDKLAMEGQRRRLTDSITFKEQLQESIFAEQEQLLANDIKFRELMDADADEFTEKMANIDLATAEQLVMADISAANERLKYEGYSNLMSTGMKVGGQLYESDSKRSAIKRIRPEATDQQIDDYLQTGMTESFKAE